MQKLLIWAGITVTSVVLVHLVALLLGATYTQANATIFILTLIAFDAAVLARRGEVSPVILAGCLSAAFLLGTGYGIMGVVAILIPAIIVGAEVSKLKRRSAFLMCLVEGLGIYGAIAYSVWWPAPLAVVILGAWWFSLDVKERRAALASA